MTTGITNGNAKLSDSDVRNMRELRHVHGMSYGKIAEKFEICRSTAYYVCNFMSRAIIGRITYKVKH
jgi:hypothetical protein